MKTKQLNLAGLIGAAVMGLSQAFVGTPMASAQDTRPELPASRTLCCCPVAIPGGQLTLVGLPGAGVPVSETAATVAQPGGTSLTVSGNQSAYGTGAFYADVNGASVKITAAVGAGPTTLTLAFPVTAAIGDAVEIIPAKTIGELLGATNQYGFDPQATPADTVFDTVYLETSGSLVRFAFASFIPPSGSWIQIGGGPANSRPIDPNASILVQRQAGASITLPIYCIAPCKDQRIDVATGLNQLAWPFAKAVTLDETGLSAIVDRQLNPADTVFDTVYLVRSGALVRYVFAQFIPPSGQWIQVGGGPSGTQVIKACEGFILQRVAGPTSLSVQEPSL